MRELEEGEKPVAIHVENRPKRVRMGGATKRSAIYCLLITENYSIT